MASRDRVGGNQSHTISKTSPTSATSASVVLGNGARQIPLSIVMTYPVRWRKYEILRDYIQNFYDSVGYAKWDGALHHEYEEGMLSLWVDDVSFSYEWLLHIGASTKSGLNGSSAGYFGEGFKIASLCAYRDYGWSIKMSSGDWNLVVTESAETIDGQSIKMLAYSVWEAEDSRRSKLVLGNLCDADYVIFKNALLSFYYPANPLLGDKIWEGPSGAVYTRSTATYCNGLPYTDDFGRRGAVFCGFQLLGSNPFDLVVCLHNWRNSDRERKALYSFNVINVFEKIAYRIDSNGAMIMLEKMRRYWNTLPAKKIDIHSWYPVICNLIRTIRKSTEVQARFRAKYPNLLCLKRIRTVHEQNRRGQAKSWLSNQETSYKLVQYAFGSLGYPTLEDKCEECGGFVVDDSPTAIESRCFEIIEGLIDKLYSGFVVQEAVPARKVIRNRQAAYHGMATLYKAGKRKTNSRGLVIRYDVGEIYLKEEIFTADGYFDAVSTYVHELCHAFGGDSSAAFGRALTYAMELLLMRTDLVENHRRLWGDVFGGEVSDNPS